MFENKKQKLAPPEVYHKRIAFHLLLSALLLLICLTIGVIGYKTTIPNFGWYNSLLNASMILSGMGPIIEPQYNLSNTAKVFASAYALFSGIAFLTNVGLMIAPVAHRFFHKIHLEDQ